MVEKFVCALPSSAVGKSSTGEMQSKSKQTNESFISDRRSKSTNSTATFSKLYIVAWRKWRMNLPQATAESDGKIKQRMVFTLGCTHCASVSFWELCYRLVFPNEGDSTEKKPVFPTLQMTSAVFVLKCAPIHERLTRGHKCPSVCIYDLVFIIVTVYLITLEREPTNYPIFLVRMNSHTEMYLYEFRYSLDASDCNFEILNCVRICSTSSKML